MLLKEKARLLMIGDSITDCGRSYDAEPASEDSLGNGYVSLVNACLTGLMPENKVMVMNKGINGNRITDLEKRWDVDVMQQNPDWVSVMIGINDVWRQFDSVLKQVEQVSAVDFERSYRRLIEKTLPKVQGMILLSPFMIIEHKEDPMRKKVEALAQITKELATEYTCLYVDVQARMDTFMQSLPCWTLSYDHVHPNTSGHMMIAQSFLEAIGFK